MRVSVHRGEDFADHLAYFVCPSIDQDGWLPYRQLSLPVGDLGFRQGVTAVERIRTYSGSPFRVRQHLDRFQNTLRLVCIDGVPPTRVLSGLIDESFERNAAFREAHGDVGITLWATPGSRIGDRPTFALHLNRIDHAALSLRRTQGQAVVLTDIVQPAAGSWSRQAKVRCRLHYYLADVQAESIISGATGVLQDDDGSWTESSVANIALVFGREIVFAPAGRVLPGITQSRVCELASGLSLMTREASLTAEAITCADALLLMGTDTGLWFAKTVHDAQGKVMMESPSGATGNLIAELQARFCC